MRTEAYRIRNGWGLSPLRNKRELKALIEFCKEQLKEEHIQKYNPDKKLVFETTIKMYELGNSNFYYYVNDNVGHYWS